MQLQNDAALNGNNSDAQNEYQSPDPKSSGLNSDQDTIVNEEEQGQVTNGDQADTGETDKERSFHKNEMPDTDRNELPDTGDADKDDELPRIGDEPGEIERISPKM